MALARFVSQPAGRSFALLAAGVFDICPVVPPVGGYLEGALSHGRTLAPEHRGGFEPGYSRARLPE